MYCVFVLNNVPCNVNKTSVNTTAYTHCVVVTQLPGPELTCVICLRVQRLAVLSYANKNISDDVHKKISRSVESRELYELVV